MNLDASDLWRVIKLDDWAEIRRLRRAEQLPIKEIARRWGIARNTVRAALASDTPPRYRRGFAVS
jgi:DNA-binding transcriptional regulator YiaG